MSCLTSGPFSQTLFLGASIVSANLNLGWSQEPSTCKVTLFQDSRSAYGSDQNDAFKTHLASINNRTNDKDATSTALSNSQSYVRDDSKSLTRNIATALGTKMINEGGASKLLYNLDSSNSTAYWPEVDPGFIGNELDIMGVPVRFKFNALEFSGRVMNWTVDPYGVYEVEIQNMAGLLNNTNLILQKYKGTISSTIAGTSSAFDGRFDLAVPYNSRAGNYNGSIYQGNIPNLINIYGFLERGDFGDSGVSKEKGISAALLYDTIITLLGQTARNEGYYSPYGSLVAKSAYDYAKDIFIDPFTSTITSNGNTINYTQLGLLHCPLAVDHLRRSLFKLDISQVQRPPNGVFINDDSMSVLAFIDYCCDNAGQDYTVDLTPSYTYGDPYTGTIRINTVSRKTTISTSLIQNFINNDLNVSDKIVDYKRGLEYNDVQTRTVVVGGQQRRLHQFMTENSSIAKHFRIFEPQKGWLAGWFSVNNQNANNIYRQPNYDIQRPFDSSNGDPWRSLNNAAVAQEDNSFYSVAETQFSMMIVNRGGYFSQQRPVEATEVAADFGYAMHNDLISPYFGLGGDGTIRETYWSGATQQIYIRINNADIAHAFPTGLGSGTFMVSETELRAAIGSQSAGKDAFETWLTYTLLRAKFGHSSQIAQLVHTYITQQAGASFANHLFDLNLTSNQLMAQYVYNLQEQIYGGGLPTASLDLLNIKVWMMFASDFLPIMKEIHSFLQNMGKAYYGRTYMVRLPRVEYAQDNTGKIIASYEITDSAWEEVGNSIDDTMSVGSNAFNSIALADGRIGPLLGFDASAEFYRAPIIGNVRTNLFPVGSTYYPLVHNLKSYVVLPYLMHTNGLPPGVGNVVYSPYPVKELAHGGTVPQDQVFKLYTPASILAENYGNTATPQIIFINQANPRTVLSTSSAMRLQSGTDTTDLMQEILAMARAIDPTGTNLPEFYFYLAFRGLNPIVPDTYETSMRAALPVFAAVPIQSNYHTYGPWVSHPGLQPNLNEYNSLVGQAKVIIDDNLVPWEYGGMINLDTAALALAGEGDKYEQIMEYGHLTVADALFRDAGLGERLLGGPYINNININQGDNGIQTRYEFRTFSRKIGFYNKAYADQIKFLQKQRTELTQKFRGTS